MFIPQESGMRFELDVADGSMQFVSHSGYTGVSDLPILPDTYGHFIAGPRHFTERDTFRRLWQIFITHAGSGRFITEGREFIAGPGSIILLDCSHPHRYETVGELWDYEWVNFLGSACPQYYELINPHGFQVYELGTDPKPTELLHNMALIFQRHDVPGLVHSCTQIIRLLDAFYTLVIEQERSRIDLKQGSILQSIDYMNAHYREEISLDDLAGAAYLSKYHFTRQFRNYTGLTPVNYLNSIRLGHAKSLLLISNGSLDEVAWQTGFRSAKTLIRQFRQSMGITPGEFRRNAGVWAHDNTVQPPKEDEKK